MLVCTKVLSKMNVIEIKTKYTPIEIFEIFSNDKNPFFLDSNGKGKYSYIGSNPFDSYIGNDLDAFQKKLDEYKVSNINNLSKEHLFTSGAVGYFSYDLKNKIEKLPQTAKNDISIPLINFHFYDGIIIIDNDTNKVYIKAFGINDNADNIVNKIADRFTENIEINTRNYQVGEISSNMTKSEYVNKIEAVKSYIKTGDVYQINLTQRFSCSFDGESIALYKNLRNINPSPFGAYLKYDDFTVVSSSPERFIKRIGDKLLTSPIKGTRKRGSNKVEDELLKKDLINSEKDRSELLMIVDLERNDFGRIAKVGSVKVTDLFRIEEHPSVYHLVSDIEATLDSKINVAEILKATFPGGSITGAPKIRAMEIIDELEPTTRNLYTGSIGWIDFNGDMDLNIVIRTILIKDNKAYFNAGGGIVWDSSAEEEYEESLLKARALVKALKNE